MATVQDALIAELAVKTEVLAPSLLDECLREQRTAQSSGQRLSLLQVLVRRHLITPSDLVGLMKAIESASFQCTRCKKAFSYAALDPEGSLSCPTCRGTLETREDDSKEISQRLTRARSPAPAPVLSERREAPRVEGPQPTPTHPPTDHDTSTKIKSKRVSGVSPSQRMFGQYEIISELGRGGMGVVYKARQPSLDRVVALKVLIGGDMASPTQVKRFAREAELMARLKHANIVAVHDVGQIADSPYFTMDFVDGRPLSERIKSKEITAKEALTIARDVARALEHAHRHGIVHRDVKPANILVDARGRSFVTDFGLARDMDDEGGRLTRSGATVGTPYYMSPEQARGDRKLLSPSADIYSLGVVLYEALTFDLPFRGKNSVDLAKKILTEEPKRPREIDPKIDQDAETIVLRAMAKEPADRYPDAKALADDLDRALKGEPIHARRTGVFMKQWRGAIRSGALAPTIAIAAGVVAVIGIAVFVYVQLGKIQDERHRREQEEQLRRLDEEKKRKEAEERAALEARRRMVEEKLREANDAFAKADSARGDRFQDLIRTAASRAADAIALDAKEPRAYLLRGRARESRREIDGALDDYAKARELDASPRSALRAEAGYRAARLLVRARDDIPGAIALMKDVEKSGAPPWAALAHGVPLILAQEKDAPRALEDAEKAIQQDDGCAEAFELAAMCLADPKVARMKEALARLDRALELDRKSARTWAQRGLVRAAIGSSDDALDDVTRALELDPDDELGLTLHAQLLAGQKRYTEAIADLKRLLALSKKDEPKILLELARLYVLDDKLETAQLVLERAKKAMPGAPEPYLLLARAYAARDLIDLAARELEAGVAAVSGEKQKDELAATLLELLLDNRRFDDAETFAKKRVKDVGASDPRARYRLGLLYAVRDGPGDAERALKIFDDLTRDFPKDLPPLEGKLKILVLLGRVAEARATLSELLERRSDDAQAWLLASMAQRRLGDKEKSLESARKAASLAPDDPEVVARVAIAEIDAHDIASADRRVRDALRTHRDHAGLFIALGAVELQQGRIAQAQAAFQRALAIDPSDMEAAYGLGRTMLRQGQLDAAIRLSEQCVKVAGLRAHPGIIETLGVAYAGRKRWKDAAKFLAIATQNGTKEPGVWLAYADALEGIGDKPKSLDAARAALKIDPEFAPAREWLEARGVKK